MAVPGVRDRHPASGYSILAAHQIRDDQDEFAQVERFGKVCLKPRDQRPFPVFGPCKGGKRDGWNPLAT